MESLPSEIKLLLVSFLDNRSRRLLRLTSLQWFNIVRYDNFRFKFNRTKLHLLHWFLERLGKYNFPIGLELLDISILTNYDYELLGKITQLTKFLIPGFHRHSFSSRQDLAPLTNLTNLKEVEVVPYQILRYFTNLTTIQLYDDNELRLDLRSFSKLDSITWHYIDIGSTLDPLAIYPYPERITKLHFRSPQQLKFMQDHLLPYSNLKVLHLTAMVNEERIFEFCHLPNLERMSVQGARIGNLSRMHPNQKLTNFLAKWSEVDFTALGTLTSLKLLAIDGSKPGNLPVDASLFLPNLTNLEELHLDRKFDTAFIFSTKLTTLSAEKSCDFNDTTRLTNLKSIVMSKGAWECSLDGLSNLINLTQLLIGECPTEVLPTISDHLTNLKSLEIPRMFNRMTKVMSTSKLTALERLKLFNASGDKLAQMVSATELTNCKQMRSLKVTGPSSDATLVAVLNMTNLEELLLWDCSLISDEGIALLTALNHLTCLSLNKCSQSVKDVALTLLTHVVELRMS